MAKGKEKAKSKKGKKRPVAKNGLGGGKTPFERRPHAGVGDLRLVRQHMDAYRGGEGAALEVLSSLGRDASYAALTYAEELEDPELIEFSRRLVAVPPAIETNLHDLREASVDNLVAQALADEAPALRGPIELEARGSLALFDPAQVKSFLARGGRARKEASEEHAGTLAMFGLGLGTAVRVEVRAQAAEPEVSVVRRRLRVGSGVVAVGLPEASDGPRLGTVRLDFARTGLDDALERGHAQLFRLPNGIWRVEATHPSPDVLRLYVSPDPEADAPLTDLNQGVPGP